jgi:hypothetical protein
VENIVENIKIRLLKRDLFINVNGQIKQRGDSIFLKHDNSKKQNQSKSTSLR